tara:strand:+ start:526 stop:2580 length:2055 start_codon:yes stop_codon:yes gene_type:complete
MRKRNSKGQFAKKTKNSETSFIQLNTYTSPIVQEVNGEDWISYGEYNDHFQFLIDRFNGSPTNSACINGVSQQIYGKGLNATDSNRKPNEYAQMVSLFKKDLVRKLCYDLKLMGQCAIQVVYSKDRSVIAEIEHMPIETLRAAKCDEDGNIPAYYYFNDWANITKADEPLRIPAWGMSNADIEILYIKPYKSGFYYYSPVDYQGGLQYAELEEEVSNYHLNNIMNGLSPGLLLNFNNGVPNQQERKLIESRIAAKFQGSSNSGRMIVSFNDNKESQAEITPVQLSDAHNQYQFLSEECTTKVMLAHRIVSPKLLGINNGSGFGNNAEEITQASILMDNTIIRPFQELLIENFDKILAYNDISLNLYFTTLQPLEFTEVDQTLQDKETIEEETGIELSNVGLKIIDGKQAYDTKEEAIKVAEEQGCGGYHEHEVEGVIYYMPCVSHEEFKAPCWDGYEQIGTKTKDGKEVPNCVPLKKELKKDERDFLTDELGEAILDALKYEPMGDDYELVATRVHSDDNTSTEDWANSLIKEKKSSFKKFADYIKSKPTGESKLDKSYYKIRYSYQEKVSSTNSREFCKLMMARTSKGVVYRKEDIDLASEQGVNSQFGHKGRRYSLFRFKGGIYCGHFFQEELYRMKTKTEKYISKGEQVNSIPNSYQPKGKEYQETKIAPIDMKDRGAYPN